MFSKDRACVPDGSKAAKLSFLIDRRSRTDRPLPRRFESIPANESESRFKTARSTCRWMGECDACLGPLDTSGTGISKSNAALVCVGSRELARNRRCGALDLVALFRSRGRMAEEPSAR